MDSLSVYAVSAGGIFVALLFFKLLSIIAPSSYMRTISFVTQRSGLFSVIVSRHLTLPYVLRRHQFCGPWTRAGVLLHFAFTAINIFLIFFKAKSLNDCGRRAGELALINLIFPLSGANLSYLADTLGIRWSTCRKLHRTTGWIAAALLLFHMVVSVRNQGYTFSLSEIRNIFTMLAGISFCLTVLTSIPWFRQWSYEIFLRGHQLLTGFFVYSTWQHLTSQSHSSRTYLIVAMGILVLTLSLQVMTLLYRNGLFTGRGTPRAIVSFSASISEKNDTVINAVHIRVSLPRPVKVKAGQYINLWMPSVNLWSWTQTHPFMITSWSTDAQDSLELYVQPCNGLTADLCRYARDAAGNSLAFVALFSGPHGVSEDVKKYRTILVFASGSGIAAAIPYLKQIIHDYNTCISKIEKLHFVWQLDSPAEMNSALHLLNALLDDDNTEKGHKLHISIYIQGDFHRPEYSLGEHDRVFIYGETPDYKTIILDKCGDKMGGLLSPCDGRSQTLVIVSATNGIRDHIRETVREYLNKGLKLSEQEYQP
ncbi:hypothetical protein ASPNIDRAFT_184149, partial [Aspergillus niger ATCC 1015]